MSFKSCASITGRVAGPRAFSGQQGQAPAAEEAKIVSKGRANKPLDLWLLIELPSSQIVCIVVLYR
jgi:hypothetical protein